MYTDNWFKLHRKIFKSNLWNYPDKMRFFIYLVGQARYKEKPNTKYKDKGIIIERGQFLRSYRKIQEDLQYLDNNTVKQYSLSRIHRLTKKLKDEERIKTEKTDLGTLFTIINYAKYQDKEQKKDKKIKELETALEHLRNTSGTPPEQYSKKDKESKEGKVINNIVPKTEIKKIYNSLPNYWKSIFEDYIDIYRSKNKTNKITTNKHYKLLSELYYIFRSLKFKFDKQDYELTEDIFEHGLNQVIEKNIDNLNYAKKVWISDIEKGGPNGKQVQKNNRKKERKSEEESIFNTG